MSSKPSDATALRTARSQLRKLERELHQVNVLLSQYRGRATKAEAEAADWRKRFDILLSREPVRGTEQERV